MTNIAFALPEQLFSLINNRNVLTVIVIKYMKLRSVGKTRKTVKCSVRSEPKSHCKSKQEQAQLTMLLKHGRLRNYLTKRLQYQSCF